MGQPEKFVSRRGFLRMSTAAVAATALAACAPDVVKETVIVEKPVEEVIKETVIVEGTPQVVERVVTATPRPLSYEGELWVYFRRTWIPTIALSETGKAAGVKGSQAMDECIAEWEALHPGVTIKAYELATRTGDVSISNPLSYFVNTSLPQGDGPDIFDYSPNSSLSGGIGDRGLVLALDPYLDMPNPYIPEGQAGHDRWADAFTNDIDTLSMLRSPRGYHYAFPFVNWQNTAWYNKTVFDELGLEWPDPACISDILEVLETLKQAGYECPISGWNGPGSGWDAFWFGGHFLEELALNEWDVLDYGMSNVDGMVEAEEYARAISKGLFVPSESEHFRELLRVRKLWIPYWSTEWKLGKHGNFGDFISGEVPVFMHESGAVTKMQNPEIKFEVAAGCCPVVSSKASPLAPEDPHPFQGGYICGYHVSWMTKKRGTTEAAIDWLRFLGTPATMAKLVKDAPGSKPIFKGVEPEDLGFGLARFLRTPGRSGPMFNSFQAQGDGTLRSEAADILARYYVDEITLDECATEFDRALTAFAERVIEANDKSVNPSGLWDLSQW